MDDTAEKIKEILERRCFNFCEDCSLADEDGEGGTFEPDGTNCWRCDKIRALAHEIAEAVKEN